MEERIKALLKSATSVTVLDEPKPGVFPCVTFHLFGLDGALFGGGKSTEEIGSCQVDIWYQKKSQDIKTEIKNISEMIKNQNSFSYPVMDYSYENSTKMHHTYYTFELLKESED
jgi:hypothetical protein